MRTLLLLGLLAATLCCSDEPVPVSSPPPTGEGGSADVGPAMPPLMEPPPAGTSTEEPGSEPEEPASPEPSEWGTIAKEIREEIDPEDELVRRDLDATKLTLDLKETPIEDAANYVAQFTNRRIRVLPLIHEELSRDELLVTMESETTTGSGALDMFCAQTRLRWWIADGIVVIGTEAASLPPMVEVRYPVGAIGSLEPDATADRIRDTIAVDVWDEGGEVEVSEENVLSVRAPKAVQREILALLRELRKAK